ncbi:MAG: type II/IV secretion system ATPase subunit [Thermoplasmatota archaeon]
MSSLHSGVQQASRIQNPSGTVRRAVGPRPPDAETVKRRIEAFAKQHAPKEEISEKLLLQSEMGYMRGLMSAGRRTVDVTYPVNPPYSFINIRFDEDAGEFQYQVKEPSLRPGELDIIQDVKEKMEAQTDQEELPVVDLGNLSESPEMQKYLRRKFDEVVDLYDLDVPARRQRTLFYYLQRELVGLGKADAVLRDPFIEDVSCNGHGVPLYVFHRVFGSMKTSVLYESELELNRYILKLAQTAGKHVSIYQPILDATLQDGSRINLTLGTEVTRKGSTFSIRKFQQDPISPIDLIQLGSMSAHQCAYLWSLIEAKRSILVSGGTASGKTTLLNALGMFIRPEDKIVSIEDTPEVHLSHTNWIQSVSRAGYGIGGGGSGGDAGAISLFDLLVAALRQRPEYVLVGEVRGKEASTLFQAISTGHAAMATIHAASFEELLNRIENDPMNIPRALIEALDTVIFPGQVIANGNRARRLRLVTEVIEMDPASKNMITNDVFAWRPEKDDIRYLGRSFVLERIGKAQGRSIDQVTAEVERKAAYLKMMQDAGINYFKDVTKQINAYYLDPDHAVEQLAAKLPTPPGGF